MDTIDYFYPLLVALGLNLFFFAFAYTRQTDKLTDFTYGLSFLSIIVLGLVRQDDTDLPRLIAAGFVAIWAFRLVAFLVYRIHKMGRDKRFDKMRGSLVRFGSFWLLQAVVAWIVAMPAYIVINSEMQLEMTGLAWFSVLFFGTGLIIETTADLQKLAFRARKTGKWIDEGLWSSIQHPNYLGEIIIWLAVADFALATGAADGSGDIAWIIASPVLIFLILRFVSGVPKLQKYAKDKWGKDKAFQDYQKRTGLLVPKLWK